MKMYNSSEAIITGNYISANTRFDTAEHNVQNIVGVGLACQTCLIKRVPCGFIRKLFVSVIRR